MTPTDEDWMRLISDLHEDGRLTSAEAVEWLAEVTGMSGLAAAIALLQDAYRDTDDWTPYRDWDGRWDR